MAKAEPDGYVLHCLELLEPLGACAPKRMFGGWGIYLDGLMFGLIVEEQLYLKVDDATRPRWEAAQTRPFTYAGKGRVVSVSYYTPPESAMEAPHAMLPWARLALEAALRGRSARPALRKGHSKI